MIIYAMSVKIIAKMEYLYHSESPPSGVVMSFTAKKTTRFDKFEIFVFSDDPIKKMVKIKVVVNKNRH